MPVPQEAIEAAGGYACPQSPHCLHDGCLIARALSDAADNIRRMERQGTEILGALGREQARADTREAELAALRASLAKAVAEIEGCIPDNPLNPEEDAKWSAYIYAIDILRRNGCIL